MSAPTAQQASNELILAVNNKNNLIKQLTQARLHLEQKKQLKRRSELTLDELKPIEDESVSYRAVGRIFLRDDLNSIRAEIEEIISRETIDIEKLEKTVDTLTKRTSAAEADLRELLNQTQSLTAAAK